MSKDIDPEKDKPIAGSLSYADDEVGACGATGDGDIMMRFLPGSSTNRKLLNFSLETVVFPVGIKTKFGSFSSKLAKTENFYNEDCLN